MQYGCEHYKRKCKFISPCCGKIYTCRLCHDDEESHELDRKAIKEVLCAVCNLRQPISNKCINCKVTFGKYFCSICNLFEDGDKDIFHCNKCDICRIGKEDEYFHCNTCDCCMVKKESKHICKEKLLHNDCSICLENLFYSTKKVVHLRCQHVLHLDCLSHSIQNGNSNCPMCRKSIHSEETLQEYNKQVDEMIEKYPIEEKIKVSYHCNECSCKGENFYHPYGIKCLDCGCYNTSR